MKVQQVELSNVSPEILPHCRRSIHPATDTGGKIPNVDAVDVNGATQGYLRLPGAINIGSGDVYLVTPCRQRPAEAVDGENRPAVSNGR
jgi:hypothetical protein